MTRRLLTAFVTSAILFSLACQTADNTNQPANANRAATASDNANRDSARTGLSDSWITAKTKLALIADSRTSGFETDVDTREGMVTLSGKVDTNEAKTAAEDVARKVEGVKNVNNQLQVVPEAKRKEVNATDEKITDSIEAAVEKDAAIKDLSLTASSNAGVVTIDGTVDTHDQLLKYAQAVRGVPGVKSVVTTPVQVRENKRS
jgi:osmotically-inducible protein OsmY